LVVPKESKQATKRVNVKVDASTFLRPTELAMKTMNHSTVGCILAIDLGKYKSVVFRGIVIATVPLRG